MCFVFGTRQFVGVCLEMDKEIKEEINLEECTRDTGLRNLKKNFPITIKKFKT